MKNLKNQILILLLLLAMVASIFLGVFVVVSKVFWLLKVCVSLAVISLTIYLFILMKNINKKLVYIEKENTNVEVVGKSTVNNKILCPRCYHPYDGEICFICGYNRNEKKA